MLFGVIACQRQEVPSEVTGRLHLHKETAEVRKVF